MSHTFLQSSEIETLLDPRLWQLCTAAILDESHYSRLIPPVIGNINGWINKVSELNAAIEYHGLSGLTHSLIKTHNIQLPLSDSMVITACAAKHNQRWRAISKVLQYINKDIAQNISFCLLKGSALVNQIYGQPYQRAMSDIDIMCSPDKAKMLYEQCIQSGFSQVVDEIHEPDHHHHLPVLSKQVGQHLIYLEIHTHALSFDLGAQLHWQDIKNQFRTINIDDEHYFTLHHEAMLLQLCTHAFARDQVIKLSNIVDIFRYAILFEGQIDWQLLANDFPRVILAMRYARMLLKLPTEVLPYIKTIDSQHNHGMGEGMMPLREFNNSQMSLHHRLNKLLFPSKWWQQAFYGVSPTKELTLLQRFFSKKSFWVVRYLLHPLKMVSWALTKAVIPKIKSQLNKQWLNS